MTKKSIFNRGKGKSRVTKVTSAMRRRIASMEQLEKREMFAVDFRTFDGTDNNLTNTEWGSVGESFLRNAPADYADGLSASAGADRLSAREISNLIAAQPSDVATSSNGLSAMAYAWGQFLDHDIDLTDTADPAESIDIAVPTGDPYFDPDGTGTATIPLTRSQYDSATGETSSREQFNSITAFIDG